MESWTALPFKFLKAGSTDYLGCRVPEECSHVVACLYESCMQDDPVLRPSAADVVATLESEFCFGRSQSAPAPEILEDKSLDPKPRAVVSLNPQQLTHPAETGNESLATTYVL